MSQIISLKVREVQCRQHIYQCCVATLQTQHACYCSVAMFVGSILVSMTVRALHHITNICCTLVQYYVMSHCLKSGFPTCCVCFEGNILLYTNLIGNHIMPFTVNKMQMYTTDRPLNLLQNLQAQFPNTYTYTECPRRKGPNFGRVFLRSNYTDITQNTYIQS